MLALETQARLHCLHSNTNVPKMHFLSWAYILFQIIGRRLLLSKKPYLFLGLQIRYDAQPTNAPPILPKIPTPLGFFLQCTYPAAFQ